MPITPAGIQTGAAHDPHGQETGVSRLSVKRAKRLGTWEIDVATFGLFHAYASHILPSWLYNRTLYYHWRWRYQRRQSTRGAT